MAAPAAGGAAGAAPLPVIPAEADDASYSKTAAPAPAKRAEPKKSPDSLDVEDVKQLLGTLLKVAAGFVVGYFAREIRSKIKMGKPNVSDAQHSLHCIHFIAFHRMLPMHRSV